jgi:putative flippase GtrA
MSRVLAELIRFGLVGIVGFAVDVSVLYLALTALGAGPYVGRGISYLAAASCTWYLNRRLTFADHRSEAIAREWSRFVMLNAVGGLVNYSTYVAWLHYVGVSGAAPALGVALGSGAGLLVNFTLSRQFVFSPAE